MKKLYTTIITLSIAFITSGQSFDFSLSLIGVDENGNYEIALMATPDFTETDGNSADIGAVVSMSDNVFLQPNGFENDCTFIPPNTNICEYPIEADEWTADFLVGPSNASTNRFIYQFTRTESGDSTFFDAESGTPLILAVFRVFNTVAGLPTTGDIVLIDNGDAILDGTPNESFFNIRYTTATGGVTTDLFNAHDSMSNSINFETLSNPNNTITPVELKLYPNPTIDYITIETTARVKNVAFYNILGKRVLETTETQNITTSQLANGIYLLKIQTDRGEVTKKIVKE